MLLLADPLLYWGASALVVLAAAGIEAQRMRLDPWSMYLSGLAGLGGAMLGGELYVLLLAPSHAVGDGGRGAIGAFAGASVLAWLAVRTRGGDWLHYADAAVPGIALGYALYRIGCFVNGCCFGAPTDMPWGVTFGPGTEAFAAQLAAGWIGLDAMATLPVHPTQLYHGALGFAAFLVLRRCRDPRPGSRLALALALYGAGRFGIEFFREDTWAVVGPLNANHVACLAMLMATLLLRLSLGRESPRALLRKHAT